MKSGERTLPEPQPRQYTVFLSYRHADNREAGRQWATWLHQMLETYEVPLELVGTPNSRGEPIPSTLYPVFRDEEELPADADLTKNVQRALEKSGLLLVLCSPRAVDSRFVAEEIRYFKELGRSDRIIALMIDGEPNASDDRAKQSSGIGAERECLPEPLRFGVARADGSVDWSARTEPIAADARPGGQPVQGWTTAAAFRDTLERENKLSLREIKDAVHEYEQRLNLAKLKVIAGALAVPLGTLSQRDKAMQLRKAQQRARVLRRWSAILALLALVAVAGGAIAYIQRNRARTAEQATAQESERRRLLLQEAARSDRLTAEEKLEQNDAPAALAHLGRAIAYEQTSSLAVEKAVAALNDWRFPPPITLCLGHGAPVNSAQFSPDGQFIVTASADQTARLWEVRSGKLWKTLSVNTNVLIDAEFSSDGNRILTVSGNKTVQVWDRQAGNVLVTLTSHVASINAAQLSPDGQHVVTSSNDGTAQVWEAHSGKLLLTLSGHDKNVRAARFSPNGQQILTASDDGTARLWDARTGQLLATLSHRLPATTPSIKSAYFSPDGGRVVTAATDNTARVWEAASGKLLATLVGHTNDVNSAQFSPTGKSIVTASADHTARVWNAANGQLLATLAGHTQRVNGAQFSPDGALVLTASSDQTARVWNAQTGELLATLSGHTAAVNCANFSADGTHIITASDDGTARVWETQRRLLVLNIATADKSSDIARFSPDGQHIIRGISVWETKDGKLVPSLSGKLQSVASSVGSKRSVTMNMANQQVETRLQPPRTWISPDVQRLVVAFDKGDAEVWDINAGKALATLANTKNQPRGSQQAASLSEFDNSRQIFTKTKRRFVQQPADSRGVTDAEFSPDKALVAIAFAAAPPGVWEATTGKQLLKLVGHSSEVHKIQFSPDGKYIVTASNDGTARVWAAQTGDLLRTFSGHTAYVNSAAFSPDGRHIVTASDDGSARVWDANSGKLETSLWGHTKRVNAASFSPDGQRVVTASDDQSARIWDAQTGELVAVLSGHNGRVVSAEFDPDGEHVLTASEDQMKLWTVLRPQIGAGPEWFRDFLCVVSQQRLDTAGKLEQIPAAEWLALRQRLRQVAADTRGDNTPHLQVLRRFLAE